MLLQLLITNLPLGIVFVLVIALAISVHEAAHAWTAQRLGDPTAANLGRTSLNPLVHLDIIGGLLLLIAGFGWGKPVPVDERNLKRRTDVILIALAGPASNLLLAVIFGLAFRLIGNMLIQQVLALFIYINLALMIFNLIPIPPLDGSKLLRLVVSPQTYFWFEQNGYIIIILLFLLLQFGPFGFSSWLATSVNGLFHILTGASASLI